jgi:hypothetical protein
MSGRTAADVAMRNSHCIRVTVTFKEARYSLVNVQIYYRIQASFFLGWFLVKEILEVDHETYFISSLLNCRCLGVERKGKVFLACLLANQYWFQVDSQSHWRAFLVFSYSNAWKGFPISATLLACSSIVALSYFSISTKFGFHKGPLCWKMRFLCFTYSNFKSDWIRKFCIF